MREIVVLECTVCKGRNYTSTIDTRGGRKVEVKKFCRPCRAHVIHKSRKA